MAGKFLAGVTVLALVACGGKGEQQAAADSLQRDLQLAPAESTAKLNDAPAAEPAPTPAATTPAPTPAPAAPKPKPKPAAPTPKTYTLGSGTSITATGSDSLNSRNDKPGGQYHAAVAEDVTDSKGAVVIPAGSVITFNVVEYKGPRNKGDAGHLKFEAAEVDIGGTSHALSGSVGLEEIEHEMKGQGVTAGGAARVAGGAAAGAIAGKIIGGKTGAIVGGVAGAAAGTAVAVQGADKDLIVHPGAKVTFVLAADFTLTK